jgi:hypothetical protein
MGVVKLSTAGILDYSKTSNFLSGNAPVSFGAFDLLETTTLATSASSVTFSGLGAYSDYKHLQIRMITRGERSNTNDGMAMRLNGVTTSSYKVHKLYANGSSVYSDAEALNTSFGFAPVSTAGNSAANAYGAGVYDILDFASTNKNTTVRGLVGLTNEYYLQLVSGLFISTAAITSMSFEPLYGTSFVAGSRFSLYGVK